MRPFRQKRRGWTFRVSRVTTTGMTEADILAAVSKRYSTVRRLELTSDSDVAGAAIEAALPPSSAVRVGGSGVRTTSAFPNVYIEVNFAGPQPSEGCGALLRMLLGGSCVEAWPVDLPRGRKKKKVVASSSPDTYDEEVSPSEADRATSSEDRAEGRSPTPQKPPEVYKEGRLHQLQQHTRHHQTLSRQIQHRQFGTHDALSGSGPTSISEHQSPRKFRLLGSALVRNDVGSGCGGGGGGSSSGCGSGGYEAPTLSSDAFGLRASIGVAKERGGLLPMQEVRVEPSQLECDLDGRPFPAEIYPAGGRGSSAAAPYGSHHHCHLVFTGLEQTGHGLDSLRVTALFGVDAAHRTGTLTSPLEVGADGRAYSRVFYPSLQEIWPELYYSPSISSVEVHITVTVEILSGVCGEHQFHGPQLKVNYVRADAPSAQKRT